MEFAHVDRARGGFPEEYQPHFQGEARLQRLAAAFDDHAVFAVHFDAGGRTRPHLHRKGQILHVIEGQGIVADRSRRQAVGPGDVIVVGPGEWHWHGGTPTSGMTHLTVQVAGDTDWDVDEGDWATGY